MTDTGVCRSRACQSSPAAACVDRRESRTMSAIRPATSAGRRRGDDERIDMQRPCCRRTAAAGNRRRAVWRAGARAQPAATRTRQSSEGATGWRIVADAAADRPSAARIGPDGGPPGRVRRPPEPPLERFPGAGGGAQEFCAGWSDAGASADAPAGLPPDADRPRFSGGDRRALADHRPRGLRACRPAARRNATPRHPESGRRPRV